MSQTDHQILIETKPYFFACITSGLLAVYSLLSGSFVSAFLAASLCILLSVNLLRNKNQKKLEAGFSGFKHSSLALGLLGLIGLTLSPEYTSTWIYFIPMLVFFFYDFKPALALIAIFSIIITVELNLFGNIFENIQALLNYYLYLSMACSLVYLRELRRKQLKPLRRTDNLTKAATKEHLDHDLTKEIQRSEREGSELSLVALGVDKNCLSKLSPKEQDSVVILLGKLLHNNLRLFDSYYLWEPYEFLLVLPHTSSSQAVKIANALRIKIRKEVQLGQEEITVSAGLSCVNIGDDSQSIIERASQALKETQSVSHNRTLAFRESKSTSAHDDFEPTQDKGANHAS
ncbi:MAG: diguanylate cyclase (GGDEF)-like protein [Oleiphilaceae bacterium]|jgi:diguanylate cyclase (GGDEF)-like protein